MEGWSNFPPFPNIFETLVQIRLISDNYSYTREILRRGCNIIEIFVYLEFDTEDIIVVDELIGL